MGAILETFAINGDGIVYDIESDGKAPMENKSFYGFVIDIDDEGNVHFMSEFCDFTTTKLEFLKLAEQLRKVKV